MVAALASSAGVGLAFGHFLNGRFEAPEGPLRHRWDPADPARCVARTPDGTPEDVERAMALAAAAQPTWARTPLPERGRWLLRAAALLEARQEAVAADLSAEMGKPRAEAAQEVGRAVAYWQFLAGEAWRLGGEEKPSASGGWNLTRRRPIGVVGAISPWNFPFNIPALKTAPALLAGNAVVLKPSELTPRSAANMATIYAEAGLPPGLLGVVFGPKETGEALVAHPKLAAVTFTGSTAAGRAIAARAAGDLKRVRCELGGKNVTIVAADADLDRAASDAALAGFTVSGQRCNATALVLVEAPVYEAFVSALVARAGALVPGPGAAPGTTFGPLVSAEALARVTDTVAAARAAGAIVRCGGARLTGPGLAAGWFYAPTVLTDLPPEHPLCAAEWFAPAIAVAPVSSLDEALARANALPYGLAGSLYTRDLGAALRYAEQAEAGVLHLNAPTTLSEPHMPYGGLKASGFGGPEMGDYVWDFYTERQALYVRA